MPAGYPMAELDTSVLRLLTAKFELGLFEQPYAPEGPVNITATTAEGTDLADELAERSVVLLENDGILPLRPGAKVAVIGPLGHEAHQQFATYTYPVGREMYRFMASGGLGNLEGTDSFKAEPEGPGDRRAGLRGLRPVALRRPFAGRGDRRACR